MTKSVILVGTLDTKGDQLEYLKQQIEANGHQTTVVDIGVIGEVPFNPTFSREQVAKASGSNLEEIIALNNRRLGLERMAEGASNIIKGLHSRNEINGLLAVGGSQGTALALKIMKAVPLGIPKLVLSTVAYSAAITPDMTGGDDLMMLPWVAGLWGLNSISKQTLETAAGAISGAAKAFDRREVSGRKVVGVTSLGGAVNQYINELKPALEERGYEVAVFHVTGMSGRMYERTIADGLIQVSLDLSVGVELVNQVTGGVCTGGAHRLEAAGKMGIPQIVSPGAIEAFHWGNDRPLPAKYRNRPRNWHNALLLTTMSHPKEMSAVGKMMAEKLNMATGPTAVVIPMKGFGAPPRPQTPDSGSKKPSAIEEFRRALRGVSPEGLERFRKALIRDIKPEVKVVALDAGFNDPPYIQTTLELFDEMVQSPPAD